MRVVLSDKAKADLFRIYRYLEERSLKVAEGFIRRIDANFENLTQFPFIGRERERLAPASAASWSVFISFSTSLDRSRLP